MPLYKLRGVTPQVDPSAYVAPGATLIGEVRLGARASVWPGAVVRADNDGIDIGDESNVQDGAVLHTDAGFRLVLGNGVSVGHQAMLHGCVVEDGALIGIQAVVLNGAVIGAFSLVGAGALVTAGAQIPPHSLVLGSPAKVVRDLTDHEIAKLKAASASYVERSVYYAQTLEEMI